ncbi:MAG: hypothetical protein OEN21_15885 [Myxococcales bacterium]|nr:hypothetical protein [Myxococcales bacterium]
MSETTLSHDAHFSLISIAPPGSEVEIHATVRRRGRNLAFIRVDAPKQLGLATITTWIMPMNVRRRHRGSG